MITCRKNIQFEAKVFQDLVVALRGNGGGFIGSVGHSKIYMASYNKWIYDFPETHAINSFIQRFSEFCASWTGYSGTYRENFIPETLMSYFK